LSLFSNKEIPKQFGIGLDERVVEYPWLFSKLPTNSKNILDAGSTFNFKQIIEHNYFQNKKLSIYTFYPERVNFPSNIITYQYGDLRTMPYLDGKFDCVVSHSTIEHIDMDNSIYGYDLTYNKSIQEKSYEFFNAITEFNRVLSSKGVLLLTFPFGKFKNYGFFQQLDSEMLLKITEYLSNFGTLEIDFLLYSSQGWVFSNEESCTDSLSHNPHTNEDKGVDGAAHCRCVCCIKFIKN
jgi:hypothetical protein